MMILAVLAAVLVAVSIPVTGLPGALLALAGIACSAIVVVRSRRSGGGQR